MTIHPDFRSAMTPFDAAPKCRECKGTAVVDTGIAGPSYECTACNGTGIQGDPRVAMLVCLFVALLTTIGPIAWWLVRHR